MSVSIKELLEAGVHFGHRPRNWNPKMAPFIYGKRNDIHIIDLRKTQVYLGNAVDVVSAVAAQGGNIIFVGTKFSAQSLIAECANKCGMPYVNRRWLGGMLTNYKTIKQSVKRLKDLEYKIEHADLSVVTKKEKLKMHRELEKLNASLGGIKEMKTLPDLLVVIDVQQEKLAISEAKKLGIPVVGIVDTNSDPDNINHIVPGNDDSMKSIQLYLELFSKAIYDAQEGLRQSAVQKTSTIVTKTVKDSTKNVKDIKTAAKKVAATDKKLEAKAADIADSTKKASGPVVKTATKSAAKATAAKPVAKATAAKSAAKATATKSAAKATATKSAAKATATKSAAKATTAKTAESSSTSKKD
jgi:small subunit ribosomal protein S2